MTATRGRADARPRTATATPAPPAGRPRRYRSGPIPAGPPGSATGPRPGGYGPAPGFGIPGRESELGVVVGLGIGVARRRVAGGVIGRRHRVLGHVGVAADGVEGAASTAAAPKCDRDAAPRLHHRGVHEHRVGVAAEDAEAGAAVVAVG